MMHTLRTKGFTLIELVVVIAIIGLLSSIVLGAIQFAREKAKDTTMKQNMSVLRTNVEQQFLEGLSYTTVCDLNSVALNNLIQIASQFGGGTPFTSGPLGGGGAYGDFYWCDTTNTGDFLLIVKTSDTSYYCLDSVGGEYAVKQQQTMCTF